MPVSKLIRGITRAFIKLVPEVRSGSGKVVSKSEQTNRCLTYVGVQHVNNARNEFAQSSRNLAKFSRTVFNGILGKGQYVWTSSAAQLRRQAFAHLLQNSRSRAPLFAFLGFAYAKSSAAPPKDVQEQENLQQLHHFIRRAFATVSSTRKESLRTENISVHQGLKLNDYEIKERLGEQSSNSAVYSASLKGNEFAVKMLFNYGIESHTASLYRAFEKEWQVLSVNHLEDETRQEDSSSRLKFTNLPTHENIVPVLHAFVDNVPFLPDAATTYPAALPPKYHEGGFGRNRSLFLVMPRYSRTVSQYVNEATDMVPAVSTLLLLQLLEGISHITTHGVAHRDLKTDNLLVDETYAGCPRLVICDFGCCLADTRLGLRLPYATYETDIGGNLQLMAPEVCSAIPGENVSIDYSKSDAWAAGAIAYELFGEVNPFSKSRLKSATYHDDELPPLTKAPPSVRKVVSLLLKRDPAERISASEAVFLLYVGLCTPPEWLTVDIKPCDVIKWLLEQILHSLEDQRTMSRMPLQWKVFEKFLEQATADNVIEALEILREPDGIY